MFRGQLVVAVLALSAGWAQQVTPGKLAPKTVHKFCDPRKITDLCNWDFARIDVPAVWKTRKSEGICLTVNGGRITEQPHDCATKEEGYWTCSDPDRALLVSVNGKLAVCHLLETK